MSLTTTATLRYIKSRQGFGAVVSYLSVAGIALGVAALIVVMSVMAGFRADLHNTILGMTGHATITQPNFTLEKALIKKQLLEEQGEGVTSALPYVFGQAMLTFGGRATGVMVRGMRLQDMPEQVKSGIIAGSASTLNEDNTIILGDDIAKTLGVNIGSRLTLISPQGSNTIVGMIPRMLQVKVGGIFDVGMYQYDSAFAFTNLQTSQKFFKQGDNVTALDVYTKTPENIDKSLPKIIEIAGKFAQVTPWTKLNTEFFQALQVERITMFIILTLIVLVAAFNIITGQVMLVNEKSNDIAILRTMGATRRAIMQTFFFNGIMLGVIGTSLGVTLGIVINKNLQNLLNFMEKSLGSEIFPAKVYFLDNLSAHTNYMEVLVVVAISLTLTVLASLYPAIRASILNPVEVLRGE